MKPRASQLIPWFTDHGTKWIFLPLSDWKPLPKMKVRWPKAYIRRWNKTRKPLRRS